MRLKALFLLVLLAITTSVLSLAVDNMSLINLNYSIKSTFLKNLGHLILIPMNGMYPTITTLSRTILSLFFIVTLASNAETSPSARYVNAQWNIEVSYPTGIFSETDKSELPKDVLLMLSPSEGDFPIVAVTAQELPYPVSLPESVTSVYKESGLTVTASPELISNDTVKTEYKEESANLSYIIYTRYLKISETRHVILTAITGADAAKSPQSLASLEILKSAAVITTQNTKDRTLEAKRNIWMMILPAILLLVLGVAGYYYQCRTR